MAEQLRNNKIFVYKIIHDLRHPTMYLSESLKQLTKEMR